MMIRSRRNAVRPAAVTRTPVNKRPAYVASVVFLLLGALVAKLVYLQVAKHGEYALAASDQHSVEQSIRPERGKIFIQDNIAAATSELYPIAINKNFATFFAIPKDVVDPAVTADKLFEFFKAPLVRAEIETRLERERTDRLNRNLEQLASVPEEEREAQETAVRAEHEATMKDPVYLDFEQEKRDALFAEQKKIELDKYTAILSDPNDQYELIEKKLDEERLKQFYILASGRSDLKPADLTLKDGKIASAADGTEFKVPGFSFTMTSFRYYPEGKLGANVLGFASYENEEERGHYGLEGFFDQDLFGQSGSVRSERGAGGLLIINDRQLTQQSDGKSLVLTIDRSAQFTACRLLDAAVAKHGAEGGSVIVLDPKTGAIYAMCSAPDFDPNDYRSASDLSVFNNPAVFDEYEPGSVFKAITMAAAIDQGKVTPQTTYQDNGQIMIKGWPKPIRNSDFFTHGGHGKTDMVTVLEQSLNTGAIFAMESIGVKTFADYVQKFGFGENTGIELEGESDGNIKSISGFRVKEISAATAAFGQGLTVTPLQMAMSYAVLANGGELVKPYIVKEIIAPDGTRSVTPPSAPRRVISEHTAGLITGMLVEVVENGHSKSIQIPGYYIAGKTGTAQVAGKNGAYSGQYIHTFAGYAPANDPKFVILTKIDKPKDALYAESTAVPLAHDITQFLLNQWQIKKDRPLDAPKKK